MADIEKLMTQLTHHPVGGLLAAPVRDTMKRTHPEPNSNRLEVIETVNREGLWHALTPQMFRLEALSNALQSLLDRNELVTDEAQAMKQGYRPLLIEGHADNIKITHPQDLEFGRTLTYNNSCHQAEVWYSIARGSNNNES